MFRAVELGQRVKRSAFEEQAPVLREQLIQAQNRLRRSKSPVLIVMAGDDLRGCNEAINTLYEWMDPKFLETNAFTSPTEEEQERPRFWRYWRVLPPKGRIGIFTTAWTHHAIVRRLEDSIDDVQFERAIARIRHFERTLAADGALILKFWLHLPASEFKKRLADAKKDPSKEWRLGSVDWGIHEDHGKSLPIIERVLRLTSTAEAPWHLVESGDARYRHLTIGQTLLNALTRRLEEPAESAQRPVNVEPLLVAGLERATILDTIDLSQSLDKDTYDKRLGKLQAKLYKLCRGAHEKGLSTAMVFEGWDAGGKGGIIRRMIKPMDARHYRVIPISAPTEEELRYHYLWRFWRHLPRAGHMVMFDRSWYGRVLVERVEQFATEAEWMRAYAEINGFEEMLHDHGILLLKFWMHIDQDEQLRRFRERENTPFKRYKMSDEDWRNRERWNDYELAANDMIQRTSTQYAPWHLIAGNNKRYARIRVLKTVCQALEERL